MSVLAATTVLAATVLCVSRRRGVGSGPTCLRTRWSRRPSRSRSGCLQTSCRRTVHWSRRLGASGRGRRMLQRQRTVYRFTSRGSGRRGCGAIEPRPLPGRSPRIALARRAWVEVRWNASALMLENAAVVAAKVAVIVYGGAA